MVTIKMIAQQCGVSTATVSKALNSAPDVNHETAVRIRRAAAQLGYLPNAAARTLKTNRSHNFGLVLNDDSKFGLSHEYQARVVNSFMSRAEELGYDITFLSGRLEAKTMSLVEHARYRGCDGVLMVCTDCETPEARGLLESGLPAVVVDHEIEGCGCVCSDNARGAADLVRYAYGKGYRRLAFIHGEEMPLTRRRLEGFHAACAELGLAVPPEYMDEGFYCDPASSAEAARRLMALPEPPDCVLFPDDVAYIGGFNALEDLGLSVPGDVGAMGYDGVYLSQVLRPSLTTIRQDTWRIGTCAAEELVRMIGGMEPRRCLIPGELIPGATTDIRV